MDSSTLITTTIGILTQVALIFKGGMSLFDKYGDEALRMGTEIFELVKNQFDENKETQGEIEYFAANPEQEKRQQAIAESLSALVEQNALFRTELDNLITKYQQFVSPESVKEILSTIKIKVHVGGNVSQSEIYTAAHDINIQSK